MKNNFLSKKTKYFVLTDKSASLLFEKYMFKVKSGS